MRDRDKILGIYTDREYKLGASFCGSHNRRERGWSVKLGRNVFKHGLKEMLFMQHIIIY